MPARSISPPRHASIPVAALLVAAALSGCDDGPRRTAAADARPTGAASSSVAAVTSTRSGRAIPPTRDDTRFIRIRNLLEKDPESEERARKLYALVEPVCTSEAERAELVDVAKWSASFSIGHETLPTVLALDTIEHVATACARNYPAAAYDLLARAKSAIPDPYRFELVRARLLAAEGRLPEALVDAKTAAKAGSVHAIALSATIEAQVARDQAPGYRAGMLDGAIAQVSVEPDQRWSLIDLTAVLQTRAHLLTERAIWEEPAAAAASRRLARDTHLRLSVAPFIEATRTQALDAACFATGELGDADRTPCARAAAEIGILGAAVLAGGPRDSKRLDLERLAKLEALATDLDRLGDGATVVIVARGDEAELVSWARPASRVFERIARTKAKVVVLDRTRTPRARALVERMLALGGVKPVELVRAENGALAMPCLAAILAHRRTPASCPLEAPTVKRLEKLPKLSLAVLVGRDLDAELDDLKLYGHRAALLSFRQTRIENGVDAWLKSLSDVWIVARAPGAAP
ncbi:hypothetical protein L6R52_39420 [Myxococcota bacterium]|nr:hypothetical protein [Myxococcota bacterium]